MSLESGILFAVSQILVPGEEEEGVAGTDKADHGDDGEEEGIHISRSIRSLILRTLAS